MICFFALYLDLLPLSVVYFVLENGNFVLKMFSLAVGTMVCVCVCLCVCVCVKNGLFNMTIRMLQMLPFCTEIS